ncbi:MAG: hypothetical protein QXK06_02705 [Candidatus Diapherotrites archaeon]
MKKNFAAIMLFAVLFSSTAFGAYVITKVEAENVEMPNPAVGTSARTRVAVECYDVCPCPPGSGTKTNAATVNLQIFTSAGAPVGAVIPRTCSSNSAEVPVDITQPGVYYVEAQLVGGGPKEKAWFSVSRFFPGINVPEANPLAALLACFAVLFIVGRKKSK